LITYHVSVVSYWSVFVIHTWTTEIWDQFPYPEWDWTRITVLYFVGKSSGVAIVLQILYN